MDKHQIERLLEDIDETRRRAGLGPLDEVTRRDFMKKAAGAAVAGAAGLASGALNTEKWDVVRTLRRVKSVVPDDLKKELDDAEQKIMRW